MATLRSCIKMAYASHESGAATKGIARKGSRGTARATAFSAPVSRRYLKSLSGDGVFSLDFKADRGYRCRVTRPSHSAAGGPSPAAASCPAGLGLDPRDHQMRVVRV